MNHGKPKGLKALRCKLRLDDTWESPPLHILVTAEDELTVASCLDFTVATHGDTIDEALEDLKAMLAEHVRDYIDRGIPEKLIRPDAEEYWKLFYKLELRSERRFLNRMKSKSLLLSTRRRRTRQEEWVYA
ncbi:MAG: hypothetical protein HY318_17325 [Armatimonadetes bacterium]|nr:hypothetical protein [Armatimonadota bacterium]